MNPSTATSGNVCEINGAGAKRTDTAADRIKSGGLYQRIVMSSLAQMMRGCLHLELPDGTKKIFGESGAKISAHVAKKNAAFEKTFADDADVRGNFFKRCVLFGDVGFGEAYVDGDWETDEIGRASCRERV